MKLSEYKEAFKFYLSKLKPYKISIISVVILLFISEGMAAGLRYVFKLFIDSSETFLSGKEGVLFSAAKDTYMSQILLFTLIGLAMAAAYYVTYWVLFHLANRVMEKSGRDAKFDVFKHLFTLDYDFFSQTKSGSLITKFNRIGKSMASITNSLFISMVPAFAQLIISVVLLATLKWEFILIVIFALIVSATFNIWIQKKQLVIQGSVNKAEEHENAHVADSFMNVATIKSFAQEDVTNAHFQTKASETQLQKRRWEDYFRWSYGFNNSFPMVMMLSILIMSAMFIVSDSISLGDIFFVQSTFWALIQQSRFVLWMFRQLYTSLVDLDSITAYLGRSSSVKDKRGSKDLNVKKGKLELSKVSFSYHKEKWMQDVSFTIPAKKSVALVGKSGSGKSTIVKLLTRFYDVTKGTIEIDGVNIADVTQKSLREQIAFVAQEGILFDDTLENNIIFGKRDATKKQISEAINAAQLDDVIEKLPNGLQTLVGERGIKLSGGERQRVSIARAILANRPIVILDEATSALDSETEQKIQRALKHLLKNKTAIIIAHRLSTIMHADKIVVMEEGSVLEEGTHEELLTHKKGRYATLWKLQKDGFIE